MVFASSTWRLAAIARALRLRLGIPLLRHRYHPLRAVGGQRTDSLQAASSAHLRSTLSERWGLLPSDSLKHHYPLLSHTEERRGEVLTTENKSTEIKKENICAQHYIIQLQLLKLPIALTSTGTDSTVLPCSSPTTPIPFFFSANILH